MGRGPEALIIEGLWATLFLPSAFPFRDVRRGSLNCVSPFPQQIERCRDQKGDCSPPLPVSHLHGKTSSKVWITVWTPL